MKKIIQIIGIIFLSIVIILNIFYTAKLDLSEHITITTNSIIYIISVIALGIIIFSITKVINEKIYNGEDTNKKQKIKKYCYRTAFALYIIFQIAWVIIIRPGIVGDQIHACNLAQTFYRNNLEEYLPNLTYAGIPLRDYMQAYHQQISLAFVFSLVFRLIHFDGIAILRGFNIIATIAIVIALYKISQQLSKQYKTNKVLLFTLIFTFISLPMLTTFIYGDIPSLALCLFSVYFMMRYSETNEIKYPIWASIFTMIAYMMRMNSLIFIIATVIYLILNLIKGITKRQWKENIIKIGIIISYIIISIVPSSLVKNYYLNKYNMDKSKAYPNVSYFLMAMEESWRGKGWYNEARGELALKEPEKAKKEYPQEIKNRITYFMQNKKEAFEFYRDKIASMWAENTYSAIENNNVDYVPLENIIGPLTFYQKALLLISCVCSLIVLIQNRKNLSLELLFLITIFIGGFAFHILWEAKSRYIVPYIIVLIPVASICIWNRRDAPFRSKMERWGHPFSYFKKY